VYVRSKYRRGLFSFNCLWSWTCHPHLNSQTFMKENNGRKVIDGCY